jgi:error-prone DNA polymerase
MVMKLAEADAFQSLRRDRRGALWEALAQERTADHLPLLARLEAVDEPPVELPSMSPQEDVYADYLTAGLSLKAHPLSFHREQLNRMHVVPSEKLRYLQNGRRVCVAGLVLLRQRPSTAKGITFVTLEDETGTANLLVHQSTWERYYQVARRSAAWLAHGHVECKDSVIHVIVQRLEDLSSVLGNVRIRSRDFR